MLPLLPRQGAGAIASKGSLLGLPTLPWGLARILAPLRPMHTPMLAFALMWVSLPPLMPGVWRAICYWQRLLPVCARYLQTSHRQAGAGHSAATQVAAHCASCRGVVAACPVL